MIRNPYVDKVEEAATGEDGDALHADGWTGCNRLGMK